MESMGLIDETLVRVNRTPGILTLTDANTTIGYCRYNPEGEVEYIFVHPAHRRRGYAQYLLKLVEQAVQRPLSFHSPISPLGQVLKNAYEAGGSDRKTDSNRNPG
jgi:ribosomal protein S18 acetylase RimI-like enzyme